MIQTPDPLPECSLCEDPVLRTAWEANGGLCSRCRTGLAQTVRMLPVRDLDAIDRHRELARERTDPPTVFVESYRPPVPRPTP